MTLDEDRITFLMNKLDISREEAIELEEYDEDVKKGNKTEYDLTPQQKKNVQEMTRKCEHRKTGPRAIDRKPNELKEAIIAELFEFLTENASGQAYDDVVVMNKNRMIGFSVGEKRFELSLVEKRPPKI